VNHSRFFAEVREKTTCGALDGSVFPQGTMDTAWKARHYAFLAGFLRLATLVAACGAGFARSWDWF
jgi:hypothetical protein